VSADEFSGDDEEQRMSNTVTLLCLVHGQLGDSAFPIDIEKNKLVGHLKDAIKEKKSNDFQGIDAEKLALWRVSIPDDNDQALTNLELKNDDEKGVKKIRPSDEISDIFPHSPERKHIHIIVVPPAPAQPQEEHVSKRKFEEDILQAIREEIREDKKITVSISRITRKNLMALLAEHGLRQKTIQFNVTPTTKPIQPFTWGDKKEDAHAQEYLNWLNSNINLPLDVEFYIASSKANLLSTTLASSQFNINGTLDTAIVDCKNVKSRNIAGGIRVGLEHKKEIKDSDVAQAIVELITANIFSEYPVMILLTDLGEEWQFFWLEKGWIVDCIFDLKKGITLLETIAQQPTPLVGQPTSNAPYLQRCDFRTAILQARESDDALPEDTEVEGLERLLQRPKVDIMGMLPEDDVADMRDVFDVMTPKEVREWQMRRVLDFAMQTPAVQSSMSDEDWRSIYA